MKLSIITITYNNLDGLKRTTESIRYQTWKDFEWIVIDGGSNDGSKEYIESLVPQPDYWISEKDNGVYNAQNKGIAKASGEYIICMNAGDKFHSPSTLLEVFRNEINADIVYGDWIRCNAHESIEYNPPKKLPPLFFYYSNICHQAMLTKASVLKENPFDESLKIFADWKKWRELKYSGHSFEYVPVVICDYDSSCGLSSVPSEQNKLEHQLLYESIPQEILQELSDIRKGENDYIEVLQKRIKELDVFVEEQSKVIISMKIENQGLEDKIREITECLKCTTELLEKRTMSKMKYKKLLLSFLCVYVIFILILILSM